ncbi:MAG: DUF4238 domain-containing protein [bacterium]
MAEVNEPKKHHYVPQFYLKKFCCIDDENKVPTISRHNPFLIQKRSSIGRIGYEDNLYKITDDEIELCIERNLNRYIETPISQSKTWEKIDEGIPELLSEDDKLVIYIFIRHLESRNIETLESLKSEQVRIKDPKYRNEYSIEEHIMHNQISSIPDGVDQFYLGMSENIDQYFEQYERASVSIFGSSIPIRTSTNPVVNVPMHTFQNREFNPNELAKWLPLSPKIGAMLFLNDNYCNFGKYQVVENEVIRTLNRLYLIQLLNSRTTRHMVASDEYILDDFEWAGVKVDPRNPRKFRCPS